MAQAWNLTLSEAKTRYSRDGYAVVGPLLREAAREVPPPPPSPLPTPPCFVWHPMLTLVAAAWQSIAGNVALRAAAGHLMMGDGQTAHRLWQHNDPLAEAASPPLCYPRGVG